MPSNDLRDRNDLSSRRDCGIADREADASRPQRGDCPASGSVLFGQWNQRNWNRG
jgi:hypothetical protein